ncbi:hypothetical protein NTE_00466 [Candidatus Nitrososphaera evergladensis SR1]|jgi:hypothetical protein|uniref:Uncharacterized protein n=1 Tax=Candidatus Nitrososphaera evergladensis SR1 TaxID=1459636 RepID=A0A075MMQ0_9ARCH|nr:hypothetical protein [Candidatus Nitrososphaera evergladensis]AIF82548.1 hypothetical protein NTE_00466 [Candidatus Nitrososphaera evergladensis SR1]
MAELITDAEKEKIWLVYIQAWNNPTFRKEFVENPAQAIDRHQDKFGFNYTNLSEHAKKVVSAATMEELEAVAKFREKMRSVHCWIPEPVSYY